MLNFMIKIKAHIIYTAFLITLTTPSFIFAEHPDSTLHKLQENLELIKSAAADLDINWKTLAGIIYVERTNNVDWTDDALDNLLASAGLNSSIGFCQVKLKTAYWIEIQLNDITSKFFPGMETRDKLSISQSPEELIKKLNIDSLNIVYASAYIKIVEEYWAKAGYPLDQKQAVAATLYSTGIFNKDGSKRKPNDNPKINWFGEKFNESTNIINSLKTINDGKAEDRRKKIEVRRKIRNPVVSSQ